MNINNPSNKPVSPINLPASVTNKRKNKKSEGEEEQLDTKIAKVASGNQSPPLPTATSLSDHSVNPTNRDEEELARRVNNIIQQQPHLQEADVHSLDPWRTRKVVINGKDFIPQFAGHLARNGELSQKLGLLIQKMGEWNNSSKEDTSQLEGLVKMHAQARLLLFFI